MMQRLQEGGGKSKWEVSMPFCTINYICDQPIHPTLDVQSLIEIYLLGWHKQYNPELDREQFEAEIKQYALTNPTGVDQMKRMSLATPDVVELADKASIRSPAACSPCNLL